MKKRKKMKILILFFSIFSLLLILDGNNNKKTFKVEKEKYLVGVKSNSYVVGDFVYYNPIDNQICSSTYWTINNKESNCYRFLVIEDSNNSSNIVKLMLDHDEVSSTFNEIDTKLIEIKERWKNVNDVSIISESLLTTLLQIDVPPTLDNNSVRGKAVFVPVQANSFVVENLKLKTTFSGFWTSSEYDSENAYSITEYGNNRIISKSAKRGLRPIIDVNKDKLLTDSATDMTLKASNFVEYSFYENKDDFDGFVYKQMQGFTMAGDKLFFYQSNNSNPTKGILQGYGGTEYTESLGYIYGETYHGNSLTYANGNIYLAGANGYNEIWKYSVDGFTTGKIAAIPTTGDGYLGTKVTGIAYDELDKLFFVKNGGLVFSTNGEFNSMKDVFSSTYTQTGQGLEYHNGYIYVPTSEFGSSDCNNVANVYQVYCYGDKLSAVIYVYNAKYNADGSKSKRFGQLETKYKIGSGNGELEEVSFDSKGDMYLGFAAKQVDKNMPYRIQKISSSNLKIAPNYQIELKDNIFTISSLEDLAPIDGWILSDDKKSLTKTNDHTVISVAICDRYKNCETKSIDEKNYVNEVSDDNNIKTEDNVTKDDDSLKNDNVNITEEIKENPKTGLYGITVVLILIAIVSIIFVVKEVKYLSNNDVT